ncbi:MAG: class I SAM-dependent methyltransferase [Pseudomonadota bacterium]
MLTAQPDDAVRVLDRQWGTWRVTLQRTVPSADDLQRTYNDRASTWSQSLAGLGIEGAYRSVWRAFCAGLPQSASRRPLHILDCGIGDGAFSLALARSWPGPLRVTGIDLSPAMLRSAHTRLGAHGLQADLRCADCRSLPFADKTFDLVLSAHMLEHLAKPEAALREAHRVLKPGGLMLAALTRRSLLGRLIQLKWRTAVYDEKAASAIFSAAGFDTTARFLTPTHSLAAALSLYCLARKPLTLPALAA